MADLFFSRNVKVYLKQSDGVGENIWEIPVLDGFSFSQSTNASEVTLSEMAASDGTSRRARRMFNDSYAPAEWSFSTYARPFIASPGAVDGWESTNANHHCVEEALWANFVAINQYASETWSEGVTSTLSDMTIDFSGSNKTTLGEFELIFVYTGDTTTAFAITKAVVGSVGIDFDIDGIATLNWSGFGATIEDTAAPTATITEGITDEDSYIRNRITSLEIVADASQQALFPGTAADGVYNITLTGGSINLENNISFLTPETLGVVNKPIGHVTGARNIGGSFTCYLDPTTGGSRQFYEDLNAADTTVTNVFNITFNIGGSLTPKIAANFPQCHLELPAINSEEVISLEANFHALPSTIDATDEATITYIGASA